MRRTEGGSRREGGVQKEESEGREEVLVRLGKCEIDRRSVRVEECETVRVE